MTTKPRDAAIVNAIIGVGLVAVGGATVVGVLMSMPNTSNPATTVTIVIGFLGTIITTVLNSVLGGKANHKLDRVLNGEMDTKIEAAVHRVLDARREERQAKRRARHARRQR